MPPKKRNLQAVTGRAANPRSTAAQMVLKSQELFKLVASGYDLGEAAKELEISGPQASKLFNERLAALNDSDLALRQAMLERELETLRLLKKAWMTLATSGHDYQAARVILQVVDRVADLAGLTQSLKIQISNQRVDETVTDLIGMLETNEDQIPRLMDSGVLVIEAAPVDNSAAG